MATKNVKPSKPKKEVASKRGRPTKRTPEIIERIIDGLSNGITLTSICEADDMPDRRKIYDWLENDNEFSARFARAREMGFDAIADQTLKISDFSALDTLINEKTGNPQADNEWIARSRLRVDTRLKLLAKWSPKKYGDKLEVDQMVTMQPRTYLGGDAN